ncbi:MAG TPA: hypothetical protein VFB10_02595 [Candidatus Dormibacteraeota bacterium]|nr:hypothetical protein [Candidatus Dormibacteraeota bacterium]
MKLSDLFFLASVLFVFILLIRIAIAALRRRRDSAVRLARLLGVFVAGYAVVLPVVGFAMPRRTFASGNRECFDDWCVAALDATPAEFSPKLPCPPAPGSDTWIAIVEVSSDAKRVRQRARDARVELEDQSGNRYPTCAATIPQNTQPTHWLTDELGPGESFRVWLPFRVPHTAKPAGLVVHHGEYPGKFVIGDDQSALHRPTLLRLSIQP